ncbi:MAG: hypothetical protein IKB79_03365 [Oscillospiraceae bacterium]|nr:hypothetical protein [Oscillospiraceae bacterium]
MHSLVDGAQGDDYSLDDILAEYSDRKPPGVVTMSTQEEEEEDNLLLFPSILPDPPPPEDEVEDEIPDEDPVLPLQDQEDEPTAEDDRPNTPPDNVVAFPEPESPLSALLHDLSRKADDYAERMFEEEDMPSSPEVKRMEELIPGVDREDVPQRERRPRREDPPEPDLSPQELAQKYGKGMKGLRTRTHLVFLLLLPALYLTLEHMLPLPQLPFPGDLSLPLLTQSIKIWACAGLLAVSMLLCWDVLKHAVIRMTKLRFGMDSLLLPACLFTLADALSMQFILPRDELPCCVLNILALWLAMRGEYHRRRGLRLACRAAAASAEPYLVTLDEGKWNGRDTYAKHSGTPDGFGSQIQADDGAQRIFRVVCPPLLIACLLLPLLSCITSGRPEQLLWSWSCVFTASCALCAPLIFSRPFHRLSRRLVQSGGALAGWPGAAYSRSGSGILLTDLDLFPPGCVSLNGIKVFGDWSTERVIGYTATLIRASGSGLDKLFCDLLRTQGVIYRQAERLCCYEGGGLSANIRGDQVLVGSAAFMKLMDVELPQGLNVKNAVFCAIDGDLAGIFALNYALPDVVFPCVAALLQEKISPVLATRDFNLIPAMLRQRFKLAANRMDFPPVERRRELSDPDQPHNTTLTAVLCREGIYPFSEAVVGARRLRLAVRLNAVLACVASVLGLLLSAYLTAVGAFASIAPVNLLVYLVLWLLPAWFITGWVDQY